MKVVALNSIAGAEAALIPPFDPNGYLPQGLHPATIEEIGASLGWQSELRRVQLDSIRWLIEGSKRAGILRIILDGSFTTDRLEPNDVDCALLIGRQTTFEHDPPSKKSKKSRSSTSSSWRS